LSRVSESLVFDVWMGREFPGLGLGAKPTARRPPGPASDPSADPEQDHISDHYWSIDEQRTHFARCVSRTLARQTQLRLTSWTVQIQHQGAESETFWAMISKLNS
jgi:hypothetical protein